MGGKSLHAKGINTMRLPAAQAFAVADIVMPALARIESPYGHPPARLVPAYRTKPDYGDLDIVVSQSLVRSLGDDTIRRKLELHTGMTFLGGRPNINDPVLSLAALTPFGAFQIDLINSSDEAHAFAVDYFSWNDTGSLIGRVARQMGLRFGQTGLHLLMMSGTNIFDHVRVTTDFGAALDFLGFNKETHRAGFDTVEEIYDFVSSGRYFDPSIYSLSRMNNDTRRRARSRSFYQPFLDAIAQRPANYIWPELHDEAHLAYWSDRIFATFPETKDAYAEALARRHEKDRARTFFSGRAVQELSGVTGKALGHLMNAVRSEFTSVDEFIAWTERGDQDDLAARVARAAASDYLPDHLKGLA